MDQDWMKVGAQLIEVGLPSLGGLIGSMIMPGIGTAAGSAVGKVAASAVAAALGVEPTPAAVSTAIAADPSAAQIKLKQLDNDMQMHAAELADIQNARQQTVQLAQAGSKIAWGAPVISTVVMMAFGAAIGLVLFRGLPAGDPSVAIGLVEVLKALTISVVSYWVGSSESSRRNGEAIRNVAANSVAQNNAPTGNTLASKALDKIRGN